MKLSLDYRDKWAWGIVTVWVAVCIIVALDALPLPNVGFAQDLGVMIDAGWRFYQGQRTHADYQSAMGPVLGMLFGVPMLIFGPTYESLKFLPVCVSMITACWVCALLRGFVHPWPRATVAVALGAVTGGIHHLGFPPEILTFATFYNRVGFGLLAIAMIAALLPRGEVSRRQSVFLDASAVIATLTLAFLKVNFFVPAILCLALSAWMHTRSLRELVLCGAIALALLILFLSSIGFRIDRMIADISMAADARRSMLGLFFFPVRNTLANLDCIILSVLFSLAILPLRPRGQAEWQRFGCHAALVWIPFLVGLTVTLGQSHGDGGGVPTALSGLVVSLAWLQAGGSTVRFPYGDTTVRLSYRESGSDAPADAEILRRRLINGLVIAAAVLFIVPHARSYVQWYGVSQAVKGQQFNAPALRGLLVGSYVNSWGDKFPELTNEACELLKRACRASDGLQYVDVSNLLSFACGMRSPKQAPLWWDAATYSKRMHPGEDVFDDSQFILIPKIPMSSQTVEQWAEIYGGLLEEKFIVKEESQHFRLYGRR